MLGCLILKMNEVVHTYDSSTAPQYLHQGQDTKVLEHTGFQMLEGKKGKASKHCAQMLLLPREAHTQVLPLPCATWELVFSLCSSDAKVASKCFVFTPYPTSLT